MIKSVHVSTDKQQKTRTVSVSVAPRKEGSNALGETKQNFKMEMKNSCEMLNNKKQMIVEVKKYSNGTSSEGCQCCHAGTQVDKSTNKDHPADVLKPPKGTCSEGCQCCLSKIQVDKPKDNGNETPDVQKYSNGTCTEGCQCCHAGIQVDKPDDNVLQIPQTPKLKQVRNQGAQICICIDKTTSVHVQNEQSTSTTENTMDKETRKTKLKPRWVNPAMDRHQQAPEIDNKLQGTDSKLNVCNCTCYCANQYYSQMAYTYPYRYSYIGGCWYPWYTTTGGTTYKQPCTCKNPQENQEPTPKIEPNVDHEKDRDSQGNRETIENFKKDYLENLQCVRNAKKRCKCKKKSPKKKGESKRDDEAPIIEEPESDCDCPGYCPACEPSSEGCVCGPNRPGRVIQTPETRCVQASDMQRMIPCGAYFEGYDQRQRGDYRTPKKVDKSTQKNKSSCIIQ